MTRAYLVSRRTVLAGMAASGLLAGTNPLLAAIGDEEAPLEPNLRIIDPHFHIINKGPSADPSERRYLVPDFYRDVVRSGHRITKTVFAECGTMYRTDGPVALRSLGETEYVRRLAQENAKSHRAGFVAAAGIIVKANLRADATRLLEQHEQAAGGRLRGIRNSIAWDAYAPLAAMGLNKDLFSEPAFLEGFRALAPRKLCFDVWLFHPQIPALTALARRFPDTTIVLNHCGHPLEIGPYVGHEHDVRAAWAAAMRDLATCSNVVVKLGGLGPFAPVPGSGPDAHGSIRLAEQWRAYIEPAIDMFGPRRCMFESNYPANAGVGTYGATWNAFKRITANFSASEKSWLYERTARSVYSL